VQPVAGPDTIPGAVERTAAQVADRPAVRQGADQLTYGELLDAGRGAAAAVIGAGIGPGERVGLWAPNTIEWAVVSLGILFAGGVVVPVNTRYTATEAAGIIDRSGCRLVFAEGEFLGRSLAAETITSTAASTVVSLGPAAVAGAIGLDDLRSGAGPHLAAEVDRRLRALRADDISHVQFTSGTTGRAKGAMLRHDAMVRTTVEWTRVVGLGPGDRYPIVSPFSHIGGHKTGLLATLTAGATALPFPTLDIRALVDTIDAHRVTVLQGPPTMFHALIGQARRSDPSRFRSLRVAITGAATVPPALIRDLSEVLGIRSVFTSYGLSESTGVCTITRAGDPIDVVAETSGLPIPGVEVRTVEPGGRLLAAGEQGEIVVRGFNVMAGYLDDAEATAVAMRGGWLHTGDVGWVGQDGRLRIVDRLNDMVIVGGFNVYPAEVEEVLLQHPAIDQVAVVGVPDDRMGEVPAAFVVPARGREPGADEVTDFCRTRLANFKVPRHVWLVESLPVNAAGKVHKPELRASAKGRLTSGAGRQ
jgi:acyl-CoA synthetase (AMP-forming)/AMP-acid ligase II